MSRLAESLNEAMARKKQEGLSEGRSQGLNQGRSEGHHPNPFRIRRAPFRSGCRRGPARPSRADRGPGRDPPYGVGPVGVRFGGRGAGPASEQRARSRSRRLGNATSPGASGGPRPNSPGDLPSPAPGNGSTGAGPRTPLGADRARRRGCSRSASAGGCAPHGSFPPTSANTGPPSRAGSRSVARYGVSSSASPGSGLPANVVVCRSRVVAGFNVGAATRSTTIATTRARSGALRATGRERPDVAVGRRAFDGEGGFGVDRLPVLGHPAKAVDLPRGPVGEVGRGPPGHPRAGLPAAGPQGRELRLGTVSIRMGMVPRRIPFPPCLQGTANPESGEPKRTAGLGVRPKPLMCGYCEEDRSSAPVRGNRTRTDDVYFGCGLIRDACLRAYEEGRHGKVCSYI